MADKEHRWRDVGDFVREQRREGRLSLRRLSELSGVSNPYLSQIERGQRRPSAHILQRLAYALKISAESLYVRAGMLEELDEPEVAAAIRRDPHLSEDQRRALLHVYLTFREIDAVSSGQNGTAELKVGFGESTARLGG